MGLFFSKPLLANQILNNYFFSFFSEYTVFAKKDIPLRTKFGPFLGDVKNISEDEWNNLKREINLATVYPILIIDGFRILETSNESKSLRLYLFHLKIN